MQSVSPAWKDNQTKNFVSASQVELSLVIDDPEAIANATATDNGHTAWSDVADVVTASDKDDVRYATLETNIWTLDGGSAILPDNTPYANNGFIGSEVCNDRGYFTTDPTITINFAQRVTSTSPGITITWGDDYDEWASRFTVRVYDGASIVWVKGFVNYSSKVVVIEEDITGYDKIVVEVQRWSLPFRRARVKEIIIGMVNVYTNSDLMDLEHTMSVDPLSLSLPQCELRFTLKNLNGEYNADNPSGFVKYIRERQQVTARYGYVINGSMQWIKGGVFYLSEWDMPQNGITATFTARDAQEYMSDVYTGTRRGSLADVARAAFAQADLPVIQAGVDRWVIDSSLESIGAGGLDLGGASIAVVLQYVANAACCVLYQDRSGVWHIEPLAAGTTDYEINTFNSYANAMSSYYKQLKSVAINDDYTLPVSSVGDVQAINNPLIDDAQKPVVAQWIKDNLTHRKNLSGSYRADPRLDPLDRITVKNEYTENVAVVTEIKYTYNGAFKGSYAVRSDI